MVIVEGEGAVLEVNVGHPIVTSGDGNAIQITLRRTCSTLIFVFFKLAKTLLTGKSITEMTSFCVKWDIQGGPRKVKPTTILLVTFECIGKIQ